MFAAEAKEDAIAGIPVIPQNQVELEERLTKLDRKSDKLDSSGYKLSDDEEAKAALQAQSMEHQEELKCACKPILVAEDDIFSLLCMMSQIEMCGLEADSAVNGKIAVDTFKKSLRCHPYRIILMDVNMPVLNGLDASIEINQEIKAYNRT
jgi:PleD family two-component response regulator